MEILLFKDKSFVGKYIKLFTRGKYSHAAIRTKDGVVYEATAKDGVRKLSDIIQKEGFDKYVIDVYKVKTTVAQDKLIIDFLEEQLGKKYDFWMVAGFVIYSTRQSRKSWSNWFCSELVFAAFEKGKIKLLNTEPWKVAPEHLSWSQLLRFDYTI